jgi:hypothetical protein
MSQHESHHHHERVEVAVHSNAGRFPEEGYNHLSADQKVQVELERAAKALGITNLSAWIAKVGGREINPTLSYEENGLRGRFVIDLGPRESGGGDA